MNGINNKYLLSICIPTYNGASSYLDDVLKTVCIILEQYDCVEAIVSDNCSTDSTKNLVMQYSMENLKYHVNKENIGFNANMLLLAHKYSLGEFVWFVGDDDVINLEYIGSIIDALKLGKADMYKINHELVLRENLPTMQNKRNMKFHYGSYANAIDRNAIEGNAFATFMGSTICRLNLFNKVDTSILGSRFDSFYNIFPNAYICANAFKDAKCAYSDEVGIYPICRHKEWNDGDNAYKLNSTIAMDFYKYLVKIGISSKDLTSTLDRVLYLNIESGLIRIKSHKSVSKLFYTSLLRSLAHPKVINKITRLVFNSLKK
jgi:glycosyltransferase involved in cell wall biosynthesis